MKVTLDFVHRGGQVFPYGPDVYDLTVEVEPGRGHHPEFEFSAHVFEQFAKRNTVDWDNQPQDWYVWRLVESVRIDKNKWRFRVERPYND